MHHPTAVAGCGTDGHALSLSTFSELGKLLPPRWGIGRSMHTQPPCRTDVCVAYLEPHTVLSKNGNVWVLVLPFVLEPCSRYDNLGGV